MFRGIKILLKKDEFKEILDKRVMFEPILQKHILELANKLAEKENKDYSNDQICRIIKRKYSQQILEKKITERYIELCLPLEYKRKYKRKYEI